MSAKFYTLLTEIGAAKLASAAALGVPLKITQMAVGDGGGVLPTPSAQQTKLVAEKRRADLNMLYIDPQNSSQMIAEQVIPETEGGWWIREVGLFDDTGALIAVGNCPESYKPQLAEGSGRTQTVRMVLITSSTDNITLKIDPSVVLATRKYVDDKVLELKVYVDDLMAKHLAAADPHSQYAPKESPTLTGTPKTPTAPAGNNSTQIASTAFVQAALVALINGAPATLDTLKEIAAAINNDPAFSTTINNALALKAPLASPALTGTPTAPTAAQTANNTQIATTAFVQAVATTINNALVLKAPLANPALTGTPTAPTAAQTVNNTQIATTAFVKSAIAALVASSPAALDTLNELAEALGNDPNFATTMTNALAGKQPLNSTLTDLSGKSVAGILDYLGLTAMSIGGVGAALTALDWQTFNFIPGARYVVMSGNMTNIPAGVTVPGDTYQTLLNVTALGHVELWYSTTTAAAYYHYEVRLSGAVGARTFTVRQIFTNSDVVPIENGGTGASNISGALKNLGFSEYIKGLIGKGDQWSAWQYLGLVDALNGKQQADATLTALAGLVNGANKLPYFSGVDQMATADLTAFARGLLGKADAATAKGHLGVGSAGGRNVGAGFSSGGSEIPDMTFFAGLKGAAGYQYFPNGTLLQWGTVGLKSAPSGTSIGTFPVAFPVAGQQIVVTHDNPLTNVMAFGVASIINPTQFRVNAIAINADTFTMAPGYDLTLRWFAIGS